MGNLQSGSMLTRTPGALDSFVAELGGDIVYERTISSARFLKTVKCRHRNGFLVVKVFIKPDPNLSLRNYHRRLNNERDLLSDIENVYTFQTFAETSKAGYIIRQWIASSLYDRISTRPFLSLIEKKWIAFQLLTALRDVKNRKVSHGDIKSENILVTSWNWIYLTDFASFKPTYLPLDDPSDFAFYFDTSGRRTCYIAPERFYTAAENPDILAKKTKIAMDDGEGKRDGKITEAMDCFSVGCVIAELFLEGAPLFTLSQLFKYRAGEYHVDSHLNAIEDVGIRNMIKKLISVDPVNRPSFDTVLHTSRGTIFPESFYSFLHNYVSSVNEPTTAAFSGSSPPVLSPQGTPTVTPSISSTAVSRQSTNANTGVEITADLRPNESDHRVERMWEDYESVEPYLTAESLDDNLMDVKIDYHSSTPASSRPYQDVLPVELFIPNRASTTQGMTAQGKRAALEDGPALIVLALVTANVRNCSLPSSKIRALDVFLALSPHLTDEAKLDRMVPYIVDLLHDEAAVVRASALRTLIQVLTYVTVITPSNAAIFPEYIIPNIKHLINDKEVSVRCIYAQTIVQVADSAVRYLEMGQALKAHGSFKLTSDTQEYDQAYFEVSYDASMQDIQNGVQEHLSALLMDPSSVVKRAVLHNISSLCIFLGRQKTNDVVLSHMITFLNDRDWLLRSAFFESIVDVAACAGGRSLEEYILPLMIQALSDVEETVVGKVLSALTSLCELGLFQKMRIWDLMSATLGFLYHPNIWIRQGAVSFIVSAAKHLPASDVWCILYPSLRHFLRSDIVDVDELKLLGALKAPLARQIFDAAVLWAMKSDKTSFWKSARRSTTKLESPRESMISGRKSVGHGAVKNKTEEDEVQVSKLQQLGMTAAEEAKLVAMRDYILRLANAISSFASRASLEVNDKDKSLKSIADLELQKLDVVPRTVFLKAHPSDSSNRLSRIGLGSSRKSTFDLAARAPIVSPNRTGPLSLDQTSTGSAAFEDLRRRLANINGSTSSLSAHYPHPRDHRYSTGMTFPLAAATVPLQTAVDSLSSPQISQDRPGSPSESVISISNSSAVKGVGKPYIGMSDVGSKAAPLIGSSKTVATGLLEATSKMRPEGSPVQSGRSSPTSTLPAVRGSQRQRPPSMWPISTYDGQEAGISNVLENLYLDNNRELQQDFGPKVHEGPVRRRGAVRHSFGSRDSSRSATLIANLTSHSDSITGVAVAPDHTFFVTSSDDKTLKVWDTARLERNVTSKPRHTYNQHHAKVKCVCMMEGAYCFVSAAEDGSLHVVRVHISQSGALPKYSKLQVVREHRVEAQNGYVTCMVHFNSESSSNLVYATTQSVITTLDLRTMRVLQTMGNPRHHGPITAMCVDRKRAWVVVGTSTGVLTLWDRRFGLLLKSWYAGVAATGRSVRIHQCVVHPTKGRGKWVMVAMESSRPTIENPSTNLVEVWDIEKGSLMESFETGFLSQRPSPEQEGEPQELTGVDVDPSPAAAISALVRSRQISNYSEVSPKPIRLSSQSTLQDELLPSPGPDVRAIVVGLDFGGYSLAHRSQPSELMGDGSGSVASSSGRGFMVTGSEDREIRLWDLSKLEKTCLLSGVDGEQERPTYTTIRSSSGVVSRYIETWPNTPSLGQANRAPQRISLITQNQQQLLKSHQDIITALSCIDSPFRGGIVSGDRAGVVKVWRVEGLES